MVDNHLFGGVIGADDDVPDSLTSHILNKPSTILLLGLELAYHLNGYQVVINVKMRKRIDECAVPLS